jgi:peptidoglycan-associated lipoprotein
MKLNLSKFFCLLVILAGCTPSAMKSYNKGMQHYKQAEYQPAIENFQQSVSKGGPTDANYYIAEAFRRSNRMQEAEPFYAKAVENNTNQEEAYYYYGFALKAVGNYVGAAKQLSNYVKIGQNFDLVNRAKNELENLKVLNDIVEKKSYFEVKNLDKLNSPFTEYSPTFKNDKLYFTSNRDAQKMHTASGTGFTDLYEFIFDGADYFSGQARKLPEVINTEDAHEASATFSKDGKTMIFSRGNTGSRKGAQDVDIYESVLQGGVWSEPKLLPISDPDAWDSSPALSADGKTLYFASNRESSDANGGVDIYKATKDEKGEWGNITNLGTPINTRGNELFPYEDSRGIFYFSSDGHPSLGGMDLFAVRKDSAKSKLKIENLGRPINTSYDDFAITFKDTLTGYFSSNRPNGKGDDDIYEFLDKSKIKIAHYILDGLIVGVTKDDKTEIPLDSARIQLVNERGDTLVALTSNASGKYTYEIEPETRYRIIGARHGYLKESNGELSTVGTKIPFEKLGPGESFIKIPYKMVLPKIEVGVTIVIDNIYYDFNKWDIRPDAALELLKIVQLLVDNPEIKIELSSHTDERGSADYNRKLSQKRAQSAVDYIISKGIEKDRITPKGYGEDKPLVKNAQTEEDHQRNRRTEFTITNVTNPNITIKKKDEAEGDETIKIKMKGEDEDSTGTSEEIKQD